MKRNRKLVFSVTAKDLEWQTFRGSGKGGQKRNKTSNACRCVHPPSGAVGEAEDERYLPQNKKLAFERMVNSKEFQSWMALQREIILGNIKYEEADANGQFYEKKLEPGK